MSTVHSVIKNAKSIDLKLEPFPHIVIDGALDSNLYATLEAEYPFEHEIRGYSGYANNARYQVSAVDGLSGNRLSPLWQAFVEYHTTREFFDEVRTLFAPTFAKFYPHLIQNPTTGVRFKDTAADIWMDCQPGINSPVIKETSVKGAHLDHANELFAGLLYFRHPSDTSTGGELELYKYRTHAPTYYGARFIHPRYVEKVGSVSYAPNRLICFINTLDSVHGVSPRAKTMFTRRLTNFVAEVDKGPLFDIPFQTSLVQRGRGFVRRLLP